MPKQTIQSLEMTEAGHARAMLAQGPTPGRQIHGVRVATRAYIPHQGSDPRCVLFKQINLAKSKVASADFAKRLVEWSRCCLIAFLQEPATTPRGLLEFIPPGAQRFATLKP